jgi:hypothetical protein
MSVVSLYMYVVLLIRCDFFVGLFSTSYLFILYMIFFLSQISDYLYFLSLNTLFMKIISLRPLVK